MANILLIEDDSDIQEMMTKLLKRIGHTPTIAHDGLNALEIIKKSSDSLELIITDIGIPKIDGLELIRKIHAEQLLPDNFPIIIWSADSNAPLLKVLPQFKKDSIRFMPKPIGLNEIKIHLNTILGHNV